MRRLLISYRRPLVAFCIFAGSVFAFRWQFTPELSSVVKTGLVNTNFKTRSAVGVSDRGDRAFIHVSQSGFSNVRVHERYELWDVATSRNVTPQYWNMPEWRNQCNDSGSRRVSMYDLLSNSRGQEFVLNESALDAVDCRMSVYCCLPINHHHGEHAARFDEVTSPFSFELRYSPDGGFLAIPAQYAKPSYLWFRVCDCGVAIEKLVTGEGVALLPGKMNSVAVGPGGRSAVSKIVDATEKRNHGRLVLWDLKLPRVRAELTMPDCDFPFQPRYSEDGQYVFADYLVKQTADEAISRVRWWRADSGEQCGDVQNGYFSTPVDGAYMSVVFAPGNNGHYAVEGTRLLTWDLASGSQIGDWSLNEHLPHSAQLYRTVASQDGHYLAAELIFPSDPLLLKIPGGSFLQRVFSTSPPSSEGHRIYLLDVSNRRVVGKLPGASASFSPNGRWLSTLDDEGVIRIWQLPLRAPWMSILAAATATTVICMIAWMALRQCLRRFGEPANSK